MPRPHKSEEEVTAMQARILDAAHDLIHEGGPEAVSVRRIAERLGISHMSLYTYFPSQHAIMQALGERQHAFRLAKEAERLREAEQGDVATVVRETLTMFARFAQHAPHIFQLIFLTPQGSGPGFSHHEECRLAEDVGHLARLIEIGMRREVFAQRDPQQAAWVVMSLLLGSLVLCLHGRFPSREVFVRVWDETVELAMLYLEGSQACRHL